MKKLIAKLKLMLLVSAATLSSSACLTDAEWESVSESLAKSDEVRLPPQPKKRLTLSIDSAEQTNDSTLTFWSHCQYDSVAIISGRGLTYWNTAGQLVFREVFELKSDTIDFRKLKNNKYAYSLQVDSFQSDTYYAICTFLDQVVKGDTIRTSGSIYGSGCATFRTK